MFDPSNMIFGAARPTGAEVAILNFQSEGQLLAGEEAFRSLNNRFTIQAIMLPDDGQEKPRRVDAVMLPRPSDWPVRNQTPRRGTCTAFNFVAAMEMMLAKANPEGPVPHLSEEYLYSKMRREFAAFGPVEDGTGATFLEQELKGAGSWGTCPQDALAYQGHKPEPAWSVRDTTPYDAAAVPFRIAEPEFFSWRKGNDFSEPIPWQPQVLRNIVREIGSPICISLPIYKHGRFTDWTYGTGWDTGVIPEPPINAPDHRHEYDGGHSVCIVGHISDTQAPGGGWFVFRNSWGPFFGARKPDDALLAPFLEPGYGVISEKHVHEHAWEVVLRFT